MRKKLVSFLLVLSMLMTFMPVAAMAETNEPVQHFDVSKSKMATLLDENDESTITLSLPSAEEELTSDIVFVLDCSYGNELVMNQAIQTINDLNDQIQQKFGNNEHFNLNIGLVLFNGSVTKAIPLENYSEEGIQEAMTIINTIEAARTGSMLEKFMAALALSRYGISVNSIKYGSNSAAGILEAKNMLEASATDPSRQHMIVVSDFAVYTYTNNEDPYTPYSRTSGIMNNDGSIYEWYSKYSNDANVRAGDGLGLPTAYKNGTYEEWSAYMEWIEAHREQWLKDDQVYNRGALKPDAGLTAPNPIYTADMMADYVCNGEEALWQTAYYYKQAVEAGINCYAISTEQNEKYYSYTFGRNYMTQLGKSSDEMPDIMYDILYSVSAGSEVIDEMGSDFDFVNDLDKMNIELERVSINDQGEKESYKTVLDKTALGENKYGFGTPNEEGVYPYELTYSEKNDGFTVKINTNISNFERVNLIYNAALTSKEAKAGIYGQLDLDGDGMLDEDSSMAVDANKAVYTNTSAVLIPVNSEGVTGATEEFPKPSITYTVEAKEYTLTYESNGGTEYDNEVYKEDTVVTMDKEPSRKGYKFKGWYADENLTEKIETVTMTSDKTVYAGWKKNNSGGGIDSVILHYESNGGTEYADEPYYTGSVVTLDKVPFREGYSFTGWYADKELTQKISEVTMNGNKTVYAGWDESVIPPDLNGDDHFAYIVGYPDGSVQPQGNITRAEVAEIFFRLLKDDIRDGNLAHENPYTDSVYGDWYNPAVSTLTKLNIIKGMSPTEFAPNAPITRAQFAAICARFDTGKTDGDSNFSDISGHWAEKEIERAVSLGWIAGYEDGTFRPDRSITRAEAMSIINRVLNRLPETENDLVKTNMTEWFDNQPGTWYYLAVQEATNSHEYEMKANGINETWISITATPDWYRYQEQ